MRGGRDSGRSFEPHTIPLPTPTLVEEWELNPWQKWKRFRWIPWRILVHLTLVALVTTQVVLMNNASATYVQASRRNWTSQLYPAWSANNQGNPLTWETDNNFFVNRNELFKEAMDTIFINFLTLNEKSVETVARFDTDHTVPVSKISIERYQDIVNPKSAVSVDPEYNPSPIITYTADLRDWADYERFCEDYMWGNPAEASKHNISSITHNLLGAQMTLYGQTRNLQRLNLVADDCVQWEIVVHFNLERHGQAWIHQTTSYESCNGLWNHASPILILSITIVVVTLLHIFLTVHDSGSIIKVYELWVHHSKQLLHMASPPRSRAKPVTPLSRPVPILHRAASESTISFHGGSVPSVPVSELRGPRHTGTTALGGLGLLSGEMSSSSSLTERVGSPAMSRRSRPRSRARSRRSRRSRSRSRSPSGSISGSRSGSRSRSTKRGGSKTNVFALERPASPPRDSFGNKHSVPLSMRSKSAPRHRKISRSHSALEGMFRAPRSSLVDRKTSIPLQDDEGFLFALVDHVGDMSSKERFTLLSHHLTSEHILGLISPWAFVAIIADALNLAFSIQTIASGQADASQGGKPLLGLAVYLDWVLVTQYLQYNANAYTLMRTLRRGMPKILRFVVGVMPIFMAFAVFAMVVFGVHTTRYDGIIMSCIGLFAILNGDVVRETYQMVLFNEQSWFMKFLSQIYLYLFLCAFIYVVLMCTIAIMEEAFLLSRPAGAGGGIPILGGTGKGNKNKSGGAPQGGMSAHPKLARDDEPLRVQVDSLTYSILKLAQLVLDEQEQGRSASKGV